MRILPILTTVTAVLLMPVAASAQEPPNRGEARNGREVDGSQARSGTSARSMASRNRRTARRGQASMAAFFRKMDRNQDGLLTPDEIPQRLRQRLARLDRDGDGSVSRREFTTAGKRQMDGRAQRGKPRRPGSGVSPADGKKRTTDMVLRRLDRNRDGQLSTQELPPRMKERFDMIDANGDGSLDRSELQVLMERFQGNDKRHRYQTDRDRTRSQRPKRPPQADGGANRDDSLEIP